jgi:type I restriction enzyme S subunit
MATVRVVPSSTLDRWDVKQVLAARWIRPASEMARFGDVAERRMEVNRVGARYGSVHFDGHITRRAEIVTIKGATYLAYPKDVVFSRIDIRNGAIGVMPDNDDSLAFTNEYPIYDVLSTGRLLPDYARLLCRTNVFRSQIRALVVGHTKEKFS